MTLAREPVSVAAVAPARVFRGADGYFTDSTSLFEVAALATRFPGLTLHCFAVPGPVDGDRLDLPASVGIVDLGPVRTGAQLWLGAPRAAWRLWRSAKSGRWNHLAIFESGPVQFLALWVAAAAGRPAVAVIRGDRGRTAPLAPRYRRGWRRVVGRALARVHLAYDRAAARRVPVVVDSEEMAGRLRAMGADVRVVAAGSIREADLGTAREPWKGGEREPLRLLWVGRIEPVKGLEHLIAAALRLRDGGLAVQLEVVGKGDPSYLADLRRRAGRGLEDGSITFTPRLSHGPALYERYRTAHLFVLPSRSEGTPKVVAEAFGQGLPVIAAAVGGLPHVVDEVTGLLVPPGDTGALADAIARLYADPDRVSAMSAACLERARGMTVEVLSGRLAESVREARVPVARGRGGRVGAR